MNLLTGIQEANKSLGLEAIKHQRNHPLLLRTIEGIETIKDLWLQQKRVTNDIKLALRDLGRDISDILNTGIVIKITDMSAINAHVQPPIIDKNHPFYKPFEKLRDKHFEDFVENEGRKILRGDGDVTGWVDLEKVKVGGIYSKFTSQIDLTTGLLTKCSAEGIAEVIMHEIGHVFTYFEYLGCAVSRNMALAAAAEAIMGQSNHMRKVRIIDMVNKDGKLDLDKDLIASANTRDEALVMILDGEMERIRSESGSDHYDFTAWESQADQFAARMGCGAAGVEVLAQLHTSSKSMIKYLIMEVFKVLAALGFILAMGAVGVLMIVMMSPIGELYDKPERRMKRIRDQVLDSLKDPNVSKNERKEILDSLKRIDAVLANYKDRKSFMEILQTLTLPSKRRDNQARKLQKQLENLTYNDLYASSAKLNQLV